MSHTITSNHRPIHNIISKIFYLPTRKAQGECSASCLFCLRIVFLFRFHSQCSYCLRKTNNKRRNTTTRNVKKTAIFPQNFAFDDTHGLIRCTHSDRVSMASHLYANFHRNFWALRDWCVIPFLRSFCSSGGWFDKEFIVRKTNSFLNPAMCHYSFRRFVYFTRLFRWVGC